MGSLLSTNLAEVVSVILFGIGFTNLFLHKNLLKKIIGMSIVDTSIYLFLTVKGYIYGRVAPIVTDGIQDVDVYINPVPGGLVLTGIVVSVSVSALMLALTVVLYHNFHTLDLDEIIQSIRESER